MRARGWLAALPLLVAAGWALGCGAGEEAVEVPRPGASEPEPVPHPGLDHLGGDLRDQFEALRDAVATARASGDPVEEGEAWGHLARAYHAYGFHDAAAACYARAQALEPRIFAWPYSLGLVEVARGRLEPAAEDFRRALELRPRDAAARLHLGRVLVDLGRIQEAVAALEEVARSSSHAAAALAEMGRVALKGGEPQRALELLRDALELQPDADLLYHSVAAAHRELGRMEEARRALELAGQRAPRFPDPLADRIEELETTSGALVLRGSRALLEERPLEAVAHYRAAVEKAPEDVEARRNLALALQVTGDVDGAARQLEQALGEEPENHFLHFDLGNVELARGGRDAALAAFRRSLELRPDFLAARFNLANVLMEQGRHEEALAELERILGADPDDLRARYLAAMARAGLGQTQRGLEALRSILDEHPGHVPSLLGLASIEHRRGALDEAKAGYEAVLEAADDAQSLLEAQLALARLTQERGEIEEAIVRYRDAADIDPGTGVALAELASLLEGLGRFAEAAEARRRLVDLRPEDAMERIREAIDWVEGGRSDTARERLEEGVRRLPEATLLRNTLARLLATAPDSRVRDGRRAVQIAEDLYAERSSLDIAETLAMAYAELGAFSEAAAVQRRLIDQARASGAEAHVPRLEENLRRFERGEAVRMSGAPPPP